MPSRDTEAAAEVATGSAGGPAAGIAADVTALLRDWQDGEPEAVERLLPLVYDELRRLARRRLAAERRDHTLQPTALVHEAYLRLAERHAPAWNDRLHFLAVAAQVMRRILIDHARRHRAMKRGGEALRVTLDDAGLPAGMAAGAGDGADRDGQAADLLALDQALERLHALDERKGRVVVLRFFGGLSVAETAELLAVSRQTVINDTRSARAYLVRALGATER